MKHVQSNDDFITPQFFKKILSEFGVIAPIPNLKLVVVSHIVPTAQYFLPGLKNLTCDVTIIPKSSTPNPEVKVFVETNFPIMRLSKEEIAGDPQLLAQKLKSLCGVQDRLIIIDIGGYAAPCVKLFSDDAWFKQHLVGIVEDTENGHQKYEAQLADASFPIVSVARSELKKCEDYNVGKSIVQSTDTILRKSHTLLERFEMPTVIGYGKIGQSCARHLREKGMRVSICESDSIRAMQASSEGFSVEDIQTLLPTSDLIISATGNRALKDDHLALMKDNVFISTVTSRDDEIGIHQLIDFSRGDDSKPVTQYIVNGKHINFLCNGNAPNFMFGAVMGPFIYAVQAEIIVSIINLLHGNIKQSNSITEMTSEDMRKIGDIWNSVYNNFDKTNTLSPETVQFFNEGKQEINSKRFERLFQMPAVSAHFHGRRSLLEQLKAHFQDSNQPLHPLFFAGMSGVGKSELALKFAWSSQNQYQNIIHIPADSDDISPIFKKLAEDLKVNVSEENYLSQLFSILKVRGKTLLLFDNARTEEDIRAYLPSSIYGFTASDFSILITTTNLKLSSNFKKIIIEPDSPEMQSDAIDFILSELQCHQSDADELGKTLQYLTLATSQAIAYIKENEPCSVQDYLNEFKNEASKLEQLGHPAIDDKYQLTVLTTWNVALGKLDSTTRALCEWCAFLHPDQISLFLLDNRFINSRKHVAELMKYSLVSYQSEINAVKMHRLLQFVVQRATGEEKQREIVQEIVNQLSQSGIYRRENLYIIIETISHYENLPEKLLEQAEFSDLIKLKYHIALYFMDHRYNHTKALNYLRDAHKKSKRTAIDNNLKFKILRQMYRAQARLGLGKDESDRIFTEAQNIEGLSAENLYSLMIDHAVVLRWIGNYDESRELLTKLVQNNQVPPSLKAWCSKEYATALFIRIKYHVAVCENKKEQHDSKPTYMTQIKSKIMAEIELENNEIEKLSTMALKALDTARKMSQSTDSCKQTVQTTLRYCEFVSKLRGTVGFHTSIKLMLNLYENELQHLERAHHKELFYRCIKVFKKLYSDASPVFEQLTKSRFAKRQIKQETDFVAKAFGRDSQEFKVLSGTSNNRQISLTSFFSGATQPASRKRLAEERALDGRDKRPRLVHSTFSRTDTMDTEHTPSPSSSSDSSVGNVPSSGK